MAPSQRSGGRAAGAKTRRIRTRLPGIARQGRGARVSSESGRVQRRPRPRNTRDADAPRGFFPRSESKTTCALYRKRRKLFFRPFLRSTEGGNPAPIRSYYTRPIKYDGLRRNLPDRLRSKTRCCNRLHVHKARWSLQHKDAMRGQMLDHGCGGRGREQIDSDAREDGDRERRQRVDLGQQVQRRG